MMLDAPLLMQPPVVILPERKIVYYLSHRHGFDWRGNTAVYWTESDGHRVEKIGHHNKRGNFVCHKVVRSRI